MVKVSNYDPSVELRPIFRQGTDVRATPEALFGAVEIDQVRERPAFERRLPQRKEILPS